MVEQVLSPGSCATDSLYVCVLISSVKAERVPAKNSARKESSEDDSQSEPATSASPSGAIVRSQTEAGTGNPNARIGFLLRTYSERSPSAALRALPERRRTTCAERGALGSKQVLFDL
jgi:hypothetical protein